MSFLVAVLLAATSGLADAKILSDPYQVTLVEDKFYYGNWKADVNGWWPNGTRLLNPQYAAFIPDGHNWAFRKTKNDLSSPMIIGLNYDFRMQSPTQYIKDANLPAGANVTDYPADEVYIHQHGNYVTLNQTIATPSADDTGLRGTGDLYDQSALWLKNVFRLSETSLLDQVPPVSDSFLIGFSHNEDYPRNSSGNGCSTTWKSIGVRYSNDSGLTWTRSVPIMTKGTEPANGWPNCGMGGTGDFGAMWNSKAGQWQIFTSEIYREWHNGAWQYQQNRLVLAASKDAYARPYQWNRIDPVGNKPARPGFDKTEDNSMKHGDLDVVPGESPSIIYCQVTGLWHMIYARWGGGLVYTNSSDGLRWTTPVNVSGRGIENYSGVGYPAIIGNMGDTLTTDGKATLYFKTSESTKSGWRAMRAAEISFPW